MRHTLLLLLCAACSAAGSNPRGDTAATHAPAARDSTADNAAIHATMDAWYAAMQAGDSAGTLAPLTKHFLLLEDTLPLSGPELVARLAKGGTDTKWSATFSDWRTRLRDDVAWTTVRNHETSQGKDGKKCQADFLETIVFVRAQGRWLIDRYHAAALHRWTCG
ncbi:MAG: nuclear transport factor 2 family protein [Gemmatimonadaceae bacterium]